MLFITGPNLPSSYGHLESEDTSRRRKLGDFLDHIVLINSGEREEMSQSKLYLEEEIFPNTADVLLSNVFSIAILSCHVTTSSEKSCVYFIFILSLSSYGI